MRKNKRRRNRASKMRMAGVELYFDDLARAKDFYVETLGLGVKDEAAGHFVQFDAGSGFVCLERKGSENYPSQDKAVLFFEVADLAATIESLGRERILRYEPQGGGGRAPWAVLHDRKVTTSCCSKPRNAALRNTPRRDAADLRESDGAQNSYFGAGPLSLNVSRKNGELDAERPCADITVFKQQVVMRLVLQGHSVARLRGADCKRRHGRR
jgi:catechol 2,3-dioxygenase-like lactoylglutathione lyase family enzyme